MSTADGISRSHGSAKTAGTSGGAPQRNGHALYDSEQFPVLIRLPDLTAAPAAPATPLAKAPSAGVGQPERVAGVPEKRSPESDRDSDAKRERNRRTAAERDTVPRRYTVRGILASLPSQALVMLVLAAVTALVYLLVQGTAPTADSQSASGDGALAQTSPAEPDLKTAEPKLWPVSNQDEAWNALPAAAPLAGTPEASRGALPSGTVAPPLVAPEDGALSNVASAARSPASSEGPWLTWHSESPTDSAQVEPVEPVQGWPPGIGAGSDADSSPRSVSPYDRSAYSPSPASQWPVSTDDAGRPDATAVESARLGGTIDLPQPRVDYDRTRSGIY